jgi:hypothetical protein
MWGCPHCHQYSAEVTAGSDKKEDNPSTECPVCGWNHMMSQWNEVYVPEGCLMVQPRGSCNRKMGCDWENIEFSGEVEL